MLIDFGKEHKNIVWSQKYDQEVFKVSGVKPTIWNQKA